MTDDTRQVLPQHDHAPRTTETLHVQDAEVGTIERRHAPRDAPHIVVVLLDDMGFGASSAFGGPCEMPVAERLAGEGLRYNRFHTTALCSPTRQSLMTGRNHHAVNMGTITNLATPVPGYSSVRPNTAATLAQVLRYNGYNTAAFGKMHQTPPWELSSSGPFDRWPTGEGFERFYGFMNGETDQWSPLLYEGTTPIDTPDRPGYHVTEDLVDQAIGWTRTQQTVTPDKPFFTYLSFGATHAPHHAPQEWIDKYRGRFDHGWDEQREQTLQRQKELGVVPEDCELTARHEQIPAWDDLDETSQRVAARLMEAYAGFAEHTDHHIGRYVDALEEIGALENTLFFYILGDNGASAEGGIHGALNEIASLNGIHDSAERVAEQLDEVGGPTTYNHYPAGWAHAMDTPYQWTKQVASHWGGTRVGMVAHWPQGVRHRGEVRSQWHHVIDVYPTVLEAAGLPIPAQVDGVPQQRVDGRSMVYSFDDPDTEHPTTQYFEMFGNRGIYHEGWSACTMHSYPWQERHAELPAFEDDAWELYAPEDWSQAHDVAAQHPRRLAELQELFLEEARRNHVLPMDDRRVIRFNSELAGRPTVLEGRHSVRLFAGMTRINEGVIPNLNNTSHRVSASIEGRDPEGVIIAQGGRFGGWAFHARDGHLVYTHNWLGRESYEVVSEAPLTEGAHEVGFHFDYDEGGEYGAGATVRLIVDGDPAGSGRVENTVPFHWGPTCANVGCDIGSGVTDGYAARQGRFNGSIGEVVVTSGAAPEAPAAVRERIEVTTQ